MDCWIKRYLESSIGKKQVVAATGLGLVLFLIVHLAGNLQIYSLIGGAAGFNEYAHHMTSMALVWPARAGLLGMFLIHIGLAIKLTLQNRAARGAEGYVMVRSRGTPSRRSFASQYMIYTGLLVLVFVFFHVQHFSMYPRPHDGTMLDLRKVVVDRFASPLFMASYLLAMAAVGLHLHHAISSVLETFGLDHPRWTPMILTGSKALAWLIAGGFAMIPLFLHFKVGV